MASNAIVEKSGHERTVRYLRNEIEAIKNRMTSGGGGAVPGVYDPAGTAAAGDAAHLLAYTHADIALNTAARHAAVTLAASAGVLLGLSTQELSLDTQTANYIFAGPASGAAAAPTFRAMVDADLGTGLSPTFVTAKLTNLTDGYVPYHVADATGLADSPIRSTAADVGIGVAPTTGVRLTIQATSACEATLGAEMVTNGDFATNDLTGWTAAAGWSAATGAAVHTAGISDTTPLTQSLNLTNGAYYQVTFTMTRTAGTLVLTMGDLEGSYSYTTAGTYNVSFKATATAAKLLTFTPTATFAGSVDDVSVKLITSNTTPALDIKSSAGTSMAQIRASAILYNMGIGRGCLANNTTGSYNVASGYAALCTNTIGSGNVAIGHQALYANTIGSGNVASGYLALYANTTGSYNVVSGYAALYANTTGSYNVASGYAALYANTIGSGNVAIGHQALYANTIGSGNVASGYLALYANTTGSYNVASGYAALYANTTKSYNIGLGYYAGRYATGADYCLFIDNRNRSNASNEQTLGLIYGATSATTPGQFLRFNGNVGINTNTFGTSADCTLAICSKAAPAGNITDGFQLYSADFAAGNACPYFRTENGTVIGLNQSLLTTASVVFGAGRFGGAADYCDISTGGVVTYAGTAKRKLSMRPALYAGQVGGVAKPTFVTLGAYAGYSMPIFASDDEELFFREYVSGRWDGASDITLSLVVALAAAEDVGDKFKYQLSWANHVNSSGQISSATTDVTAEQAVLAGRSAQYSIYKLDFTIDWDLLDPDIVASDHLAGRIRRIDAADPDITGEVIVLDCVISYTVDKIFKAA